MILGLSALTALYKGFNAAFQGAFAAAETHWQKVATSIPSSTESNLYAFLGYFPKMREWVGDRVFKNMQTSTYQLTNKKFEMSIAVPADKVEDDTYGIFTPAVAMMGDSAARHPDELVFAALAAGASSLCYDGQYFFDTDHPVVVDGAASTKSNYDATGGGSLWCLLDTKRPLKPLIYQQRKPISFKSFTKPEDENVFLRGEFVYGADGRDAAGYGMWQMAYASLNTLNATNVQAYVSAMMALKSDEGQPLHIMPNLCVVGPSNWAAARALFEVATLADGSANPNYKLCEVLVSPYLT
jgi:phage major head subunit gpT-like protein